jgi:hypothetical protein
LLDDIKECPGIGMSREAGWRALKRRLPFGVAVSIM